MTLVPPNPEYQFIQDTEPSNAKQSDWWLDTSANPPKSKVYDGNAFVGPQSVDFVDERVSNAGASSTDITNAVWSDDTQHGPSDLKAQAVDWSSKTPKSFDLTNSGSNTVSGSGYLISVGYEYYQNNELFEFSVTIDSNTIISNKESNSAHSFFHRFDSELKVETFNNATAGVIVNYVLD